MPRPEPPDPLDLIPDPSEIHDRIAAAARTQRILRRLLRLSLTARREREANGVTPETNPALSGSGVAHVG